MKLTKEQQLKLMTKLGELSKTGPECLVCKNTVWELADTIFELREFQGGNFVLGPNSQLYPVIPMICSKCGHTVFLNALKLGVLEQPKQEQTKEQKDVQPN